MTYNERLEADVRAHMEPGRPIDEYWRFQERLGSNFDGYLPPVDYIEDEQHAIRCVRELRDELDALLSDMGERA